MKNLFKTIGIVALAAIIGFSMAGCGDPEESSKPKGKTALGKPQNLRVYDGGDKSEFTLKWDKVTGADKYELDLGDGSALIQVLADYDSYGGDRLKDLVENPKEYNIKIRALADPSDPKYRTSDFTSKKIEPAEYVFEFGNDNISVTQNVRFARNPTQPGKKITGLTPYGESLKRVVIPPKLNNVNVTAIEAGAFAGNETMTSVDLPNTLAFIGSNAFAGTNIDGIKLPASVTFVGDGAFSNCVSIIIVIFVSETPPTLGAGVFSDSDNIETVSVPPGKTDVFTTAITNAAPELASTITDTPIYQIHVPEREGGTISASKKSAESGESITITVTPDTGYEMASSSLKVTNVTNGTTVNHSVSDGTYTFTMPASDVTISVIFAKPFYTITIPSTITGGSIRTSPSGSANAGNNVNIIITANSGYQFNADSLTVTGTNGTVNVTQGGASGSTSGGYHFTMPASNVTVSGTFSRITTGAPDPALLNGTWIGKGYSVVDTPGYSRFIPCGVHQQDFYQMGAIPDENCKDCKWEQEQGQTTTYEYDIELTLNNGSLDWNEKGTPFTKGTYTTSGSSMTIAVNQYYTNELSESNNAGRWYTRNELKNAYMAAGYSEINAEEYVSSIYATQSGTYTVNATTLALTMNGATTTFTKKTTTQPGQTYAVIFYAEGGAFPTGTAGVSGDGGRLTIQVEAGKTVNPNQVPNPTQQGYTFNGWYTDGGTTSGTRVQFNFNTPIYNETRVYAEWTTGGTTGQYTVIFYAEGGIFPAGVSGVSGDGGRLTVQVQAGGVVYPTQAPNPTRQGYTFDSWYTIVAGTTEQKPFTLGNTAVYENLTVYAKWSDGGGTGISYSLVANGSSTQTTTQITISFLNGDVQGLIINDINLSLNGMSETNAGIVKGTLTNDGNDKYFLPISGFTQGGTLSVAIQKAGVNIIGSPRTVEIFYAGTTGQP